jgi:hypothetical protein
LDRLQYLLALFAIGLCIRGHGHQFWWVLLALLVPFLRLLTSAVFKQQLLGALRRLWTSLEPYSQGRGLTPWLAAFVFVVLPAAVLFLSNNRNSDTGDTWPVMPTACNLVQSGRWDVTKFVPEAPDSYRAATDECLPYCTVRCGDFVYSQYPSGMVLFSLPVVALARAAGADLDSPKVHKHLAKWTASWVAGLSLGLFFLIALQLTKPFPALLATVFLALGSSMFSTCGQDLWQQGGVIFWSLLILFVEFNLRGDSAVCAWPAAGLGKDTNSLTGWLPCARSRGHVVSRCHKYPTPASVYSRVSDLLSTESTWASTLIQGIACGMMLACRLSAALLVIPFGLWLFWRSPRRGLILAFFAAAAYAPWAWVYVSIYGNVFGPSTVQFSGFAWFAGFMTRLVLVLVSPSHGLFVYQPWLLLALPAIPPLVRRTCKEFSTAPRDWELLCLVVIGLHLALISAWACWWGGNCWGSRLLAEVIPLATLLAVRPITSLWQMRAGRPALIFLLLFGFSMHATAVYGRADHWSNWADPEHHPERLQSWSHAPFLYPFQRQASRG